MLGNLRLEVVEVDDALAVLIKARAGAGELRGWLRERRLPTLRRAGVPLVEAGRTTLPELLRMT